MTYKSFQTPDALRLDEAAALFAALAHPVRLKIVAGLLEGDCCVGNMVACLDLPQPLVSRHLGILRAAGVIAAEAEGRQRRYRVAHPAAPRLVDLVRTHFTRSAS